MNLKIMGTGSSIPKEVVTNEKITSLVETTNEFIVSRTGSEERHVATTETTVSMAVDAAKKALECAGIKAEDLDLIIVTTMSPDNSCPNTACSVQNEIGAFNAAAIDLNTACSGFIFAMSIADAYVKTGKYETILIVSAELLSKVIDWSERTTCILFGDGSGAAVFKAGETGLIKVCEYADGSGGKHLSAGSVPINNLLLADKKGFTYPVMNGKEIVKFATTKVPESIREVLAEANIDISEIKYFVLHQANKRIIEGIAENLGVDMSKFPTNVERYGNTSSASLPILLDEVNRANMLEKGDKIVLAAFGGGLTWAAAVVEW